ncbi:hypothetical protein [Demequina litorisediminis]|uniref:hypothetical protein n=1 Tax=Demequina litorisediminis TaxID=1849022 RepID=UPI0024E0C10F|nr:hypothetical protein [Demequina litorisediminis]
MFDALSENADLTTTTYPAVMSPVVFLNPGGVLAEAETRVSLLEGIDWASIVDAVYGELGTTTTGVFPTGMIADEDNKSVIAYDADALAGVADGALAGESIEIAYPSFVPGAKDISDNVAAQAQHRGHHRGVGGPGVRRLLVDRVRPRGRSRHHAVHRLPRRRPPGHLGPPVLLHLWWPQPVRRHHGRARRAHRRGRDHWRRVTLRRHRRGRRLHGSVAHDRRPQGLVGLPEGRHRRRGRHYPLLGITFDFTQPVARGVTRTTRDVPRGGVSLFAATRHPPLSKVSPAWPSPPRS